MNGGYLMVSKSDTNLYENLKKGLTIGKPILWYESPTECYYIDTISGGEVTSEIIDDEEVFTYHDIILTKGGKTITITSSNVVTESGDIQQTTENFDALMENIVDSDGNKRFIEGDLEISDEEGITYTYSKWSLSGSHLMIVLAGNIVNATNLSGKEISTIDLPQFVKDKIYPIYSTTVDRKTFSTFDTGGNAQNMLIILRKTSDIITIYRSSFTASADRYFRCQFDLLIDADYSE